MHNYFWDLSFPPWPLPVVDCPPSLGSLGCQQHCRHKQGNQLHSSNLCDSCNFSVLKPKFCNLTQIENILTIRGLWMHCGVNCVFIAVSLLIYIFQFVQVVHLCNSLMDDNLCCTALTKQQMRPWPAKCTIASVSEHDR